MKRAITRRQLIKTAAIGGAGALLAACGGATPTPQIVEVTRETVKEVQSTVQVTTEVQVTQQVEVTKEVQVTAAPTAVTNLTVWGSGLDLTQIEKDPTGAGAAMKTLRDNFIAKHPGTTVVWEDHGWDEALRQNVTTALLGGTAPDVIVGENFFQSYAALNAMLPIDDVIPPEVKSNSILGTHKAAIYNGKTYGLSWLSGCFGFEMNGDLLKNAGLDAKVPATWDEMLTVSKAITDKGAGKYYGYTLQGPQGFSVGGMFRLAVYLQQLGVQINKPDAFDQPNFNDPNGFPVWELVRKLNPYEPPGLVFESDEGKVYTQLFLGKSAQQVAGSWFTTWAVQNKFTNSVWGPVPIPQGGKPASYVVGNVIYGGLAASKAPDLAKDWVVVAQDDKVQNLVFSSAGRLPATISGMGTLLADTATGTGHPTDSDKTFGKLLRDSDLGILPQWTKAPNQLNQIWNDLFTAVVQTKTDVKQLADDAQAKAEAAMKS
jgi:ABC-type glycerol-3-phosphate transport system substrate-binding protein